MLMWRGTVSDDWNEPANWSEGAVPTSDDTVVFDANSPSCRLSGPAWCRNLTVQGFGGVVDTAGFALHIMEVLHG